MKKVFSNRLKFKNRKSTRVSDEMYDDVNLDNIDIDVLRAMMAGEYDSEDDEADAEFADSYETVKTDDSSEAAKDGHAAEQPAESKATPYDSTDIDSDGNPWYFAEAKEFIERHEFEVVHTPTTSGLRAFGVIVGTDKTHLDTIRQEVRADNSDVVTDMICAPHAGIDYQPRNGIELEYSFNGTPSVATVGHLLIYGICDDLSDSAIKSFKNITVLNSLHICHCTAGGVDKLFKHVTVLPGCTISVDDATDVNAVMNNVTGAKPKQLTPSAQSLDLLPYFNRRKGVLEICRWIRHYESSVPFIYDILLTRTQLEELGCDNINSELWRLRSADICRALNYANAHLAGICACFPPRVFGREKTLEELHASIHNAEKAHPRIDFTSITSVIFDI